MFDGMAVHSGADSSVKSMVLRHAVIPLVAVSALAFAGTAQAVTNDGVTVPEARLTVGTGNQVLDVAIEADSPVVGSTDQLTFSVDETYVVGISAAGVGGSCADWTCEPGGSGWRAGAVQLTVSTAKATPCRDNGGVQVCTLAPLVLEIYSEVAPAPPVGVAGNISITAAAQPSKAPTTAPPKTQSSQPVSDDGAGQATAKQSGKAAPPLPTRAAGPSGAAATTTFSHSGYAVTSAPAGRTASEASGHPAVVDAGDASPGSTSPWVFGGVAAAVILCAAAFAGWRAASRKKD
jgi:hypothetical protein